MGYSSPLFNTTILNKSSHVASRDTQECIRRTNTVLMASFHINVGYPEPVLHLFWKKTLKDNTGKIPNQQCQSTVFNQEKSTLTSSSSKKSLLQKWTLCSYNTSSPLSTMFQKQTMVIIIIIITTTIILTTTKIIKCIVNTCIINILQYATTTES